MATVLRSADDGKAVSPRWGTERALQCSSGLTPSARLVLGYLLTRTDHSGQIPQKYQPSQRQIMAACGIGSFDTAASAVAQLQAGGWISVSGGRGRGGRRYEIIHRLPSRDGNALVGGAPEPAAAEINAPVAGAFNAPVARAFKPGNALAGGAHTDLRDRPLTDQAAPEPGPDEAGQDDFEQRLQEITSQRQDSPGFDIVAEIKKACTHFGPKAEIMMRVIVAAFPGHDPDAVIRVARSWLYDVDLYSVRKPEAYARSALADLAPRVEARYAEEKAQRREYARRVAYEERIRQEQAADTAAYLAECEARGEAPFDIGAAVAAMAEAKPEPWLANSFTDTRPSANPFSDPRLMPEHVRKFVGADEAAPAPAVIPDVTTVQICHAPGCASGSAAPVVRLRFADGSVGRPRRLCAGCQDAVRSSGAEVVPEVAEVAEATEMTEAAQ
jgi:hypothetical protein